jgi:cytochrome c-type biogenesis protein CcmF
MLWRFRRLKADAELHVLVSREGAFLAGNILLMIITATTLVGTIFPLLSTLFVGREIVLDQNFYNRVVIPMTLLLLGLMAMGPVLKAGPDAPAKMGRVIIAPTVAGVIGAAVALLMGLTNFWALGCVFVTIAAGYSLVADFLAAVLTRVKNTGENTIVGAIRLIDSDHRRYGGQLTHVGMILLAIGVTGSSLYNS